MSKIKSVSQFEDGIWGTETPIGADASNVDVEMSDSSTKDLQTVLGDIPSAAAPIQSQINTKVTASGGNIGNTTVSSGIQNFDSSSSETSIELLDTSVRVTNATEVTSSMWTKFNRFRKRVDNKFKDVFLSSVEDVASPSDYKTYSQSALNDYFANVVGYASASDLPDATSTIAQQLSTLNTKTFNYMSMYTRTNITNFRVNAWETLQLPLPSVSTYVTFPHYRNNTTTTEQFSSIENNNLVLQKGWWFVTVNFVVNTIISGSTPTHMYLRLMLGPSESELQKVGMYAASSGSGMNLSLPCIANSPMQLYIQAYQSSNWMNACILRIRSLLLSPEGYDEY